MRRHELVCVKGHHHYTISLSLQRQWSRCGVEIGLKRAKSLQRASLRGRREHLNGRKPRFRVFRLSRSATRQKGAYPKRAGPRFSAVRPFAT